MKITFKNNLNLLSYPTIFSVVMATTLVGCVGVKVVDSPYEKDIYYVGSEISDTVDRDNYQYQKYRLMASKNKQTGVFNCCYINATLHGMSGGRTSVDYYSASFEGGKKIRVSKLNSSLSRSADPYFLGGGYYKEQIEFAVSYSFLKAHASNGFTVRLNERSGKSNILEFSSQYVQRFLAEIDHQSGVVDSGNQVSNSNTNNLFAAENKAATNASMVKEPETNIPDAKTGKTDVVQKGKHVTMTTTEDGNVEKVEMDVDEKNHRVTITDASGMKVDTGYQGKNLKGSTTLTMPDGSKMIGHAKNGKLEGKGTILFTDGSKMLGNFVNGNLEGKFTLILPNGMEKTGYFKNGKFERSE
jgi:hypothetical protein